MTSGEASLRDGRYAAAADLFRKAQGAAQSFGVKDERYVRALAKLAEAQNLLGEFDPAEATARKALELSEKHLGPEAVETARSLTALADALFSRSRLAEAEPLYERALAIRRKVLGEEHPDTAEATGNLGLLRMNQQKLREAEPMFARAQAVYEKAGDVQKASIMVSNLGYLHQEEGKDVQAEREYRRTLEMREKALRADHPDIGQALSNLATALARDPATLDEAQRLLERALEIARALAPDDLQVGYALNNLAFVHQNRGEVGKAEPLYLKSLEVWEKRLGPECEEAANTLENLAVLLEDAGRGPEAAGYRARCERIRARPAASPSEAWAAAFREAQKASDASRYVDAAAAFEEVLVKAAPFGEKDERTIRTWVALALACRNKPDYRRAEEAARKAVSLAEAALGKDTLETADGLNALALILDDLDRSGEAEAPYQRALAIRIKALGAEHPDVAVSLNNLAHLFRKMQKYPEAEKLFRKALAIDEKNRDAAAEAMAHNSLGVVHEAMGQEAQAEADYRKSLAIYDEKLKADPQVADPCFNLGNLLRKRGDIEGTVRLLRKAESSVGATLGSGHPQMAKVWHNLAVIYMGQGKEPEEADRLYRASRAIWEKVYGPDHPEVASSFDNHARLLESLGRTEEAAAFKARVQEIRARRR